MMYGQFSKDRGVILMNAFLLQALTEDKIATLVLMNEISEEEFKEALKTFLTEFTKVRLIMPNSCMMVTITKYNREKIGPKILRILYPH